MPWFDWDPLHGGILHWYDFWPLPCASLSYPRRDLGFDILICLWGSYTLFLKIDCFMDFGGCVYWNLDFFLGSTHKKIMLKLIINLNEIRDAFRFFAGITVMLLDAGTVYLFQAEKFFLLIERWHAIAGAHKSLVTPILPDLHMYCVICSKRWLLLQFILCKTEILGKLRKWDLYVQTVTLDCLYLLEYS